MKGITTTKLVSANNSDKEEQLCLQYINILYVIITLSLSQNIVSCLGVSRETTRDGRKEGTRFSWFSVLVPRSSITIQVLEGILVSEVYPSTPAIIKCGCVSKIQIHCNGEGGNNRTRTENYGYDGSLRWGKKAC